MVERVLVRFWHMFLLLYRELSLQISQGKLIRTMLNWSILLNCWVQRYIFLKILNWKDSPGKQILVRIIDKNSQRKGIV